MADAFSTKYGIKTNFVRLNGVATLQRYAAEAESGTFAADVLLNSDSDTSFADMAIQKGWTESIADTGLPVQKSGEYPSAFYRGTSAVVQILPWSLVYNTDRIRGSEVPKDWTQILNSKWKGQIILANAHDAAAFLDFWLFILNKYGETYFSQLRVLSPRFSSGGATLNQAVAAGEASFALPTSQSGVVMIKNKGAPLDGVTPDDTTGVEISIMKTAKNKSPHPQAGRLLANYLMSREGNKLLNSDPGNVGIYDASALPKNYQVPARDSKSHGDQLFRLLGL